MDDENQILIPDSFSRLFCDQRGRLQVSRQTLSMRYELCEDLAHLTADQAQMIHFRDSVDEAEILTRCLRGLQTPPCSVEAEEAEWVIRRTAEILNWQALG